MVPPSWVLMVLRTYGPTRRSRVPLHRDLDLVPVPLAENPITDEMDRRLGAVRCLM